MMLIIHEFRLTVERFPRSVLFPGRSFCNGCDIATEMSDCQYNGILGADGIRLSSKVSLWHVADQKQPCQSHHHSGIMQG
jgi:hypothetical protein